MTDSKIINNHHANRTDGFIHSIELNGTTVKFLTCTAATCTNVPSLFKSAKVPVLVLEDKHLPDDMQLVTISRDQLGGALSRLLEIKRGQGPDQRSFLTGVAEQHCPANGAGQIR